MKDCEQELKNLKEKYDLLIEAVHKMNDLIHELRVENKSLKEITKEIQNG